MQEIAKAEALQVLCEHDTIRWQAVLLFDEIFRHARLPRSYRTEFRSDRKASQRPVSLYKLGGVTGNVRMHPLWALSTFSQFICSDPRDRIYGLLGTVDWEPQILPDYTRSPCQLAIEVAGRLGLRTIHNTLETLRLTATDPQIQYMVQQRRCTVSVDEHMSPAERGAPVALELGLVNFRRFRIARLFLDRNNNLPAPLVVPQEERASPIVQQPLQLSLANAPKTLSYSLERPNS